MKWKGRTPGEFVTRFDANHLAEFVVVAGGKFEA